MRIATLALPHAIALVAIESMTAKSDWRADHQSGTAFALLLVVLFVVPGAIAGWHVRGSGFNFKRWLTLAGMEWALAAMFIGVIIIATPLLAHSPALDLFLIPVVACMALMATLVMTQPHRRRVKPYPFRGRKQRINLPSMQSIPTGDFGMRAVDSPTFKSSVANGRMPRAGIFQRTRTANPAPASIHSGAAPDELGVPLLTMLALAVPHGLALVAIEALTRQSAFRGEKETGTMFALLLVLLFVVPGALSGWFVRGHSFNVKRWLILAGTEWILAAASALAAVVSGIPDVIVSHGNFATMLFFGVPIFGAFMLFAALAFTQPRQAIIATPSGKDERKPDSELPS